MIYKLGDLRLVPAEDAVTVRFIPFLLVRVDVAAGVVVSLVLGHLVLAEGSFAIDFADVDPSFFEVLKCQRAAPASIGS